MKNWASYSVQGPREIHHTASHPLDGHPKAAESDTRTRAIFLLAAHLPPYHVYCNPFYEYAGFGNVFSVDSGGKLEKNVQNYEYSPESAIHGMVFDPSEKYLYSADMWANRIWCHEKDSKTGLLQLVGFVEAPKSHDQPRWVAMHPSGKILYAVMEHGNTLAEYEIDDTTHLPNCTNKIYPLVPKGIFYPYEHNYVTNNSSHADSPSAILTSNPSMYRADNSALTHSSKYLLATSRSNKAGVPGYIAAFALDDVGAIKKQLFLTETSSSGGHSNAVAPCDWSDEWIALTDDEVGFLEIYRFKDEVLCQVARCEVKDPGFGMNAIWYD